ncbi:hypothetical protein NXC24_PC01419 (plasmid) [Rhizobium sp. NXC24]|nr:hypothetical protein NXC24_PC01419 [Rhizobium sp. NXC24]
MAYRAGWIFTLPPVDHPALVVAAITQQNTLEIPANSKDSTKATGLSAGERQTTAYSE